MGQVRAAAIYARISSDQEGSGAGVRRQVADCRKLADSLGWPVTDEYVDNDFSAYGARPRPQYSRLLDDIAAQAVDALLIYHPDRLTRRPKELEHFLEVVDVARLTNIRFVHGSMDLGTGDGLLILRIQVAAAAYESANKSRRIKRKLDEVAAHGRPHGGSVRPFGYEADRITVNRSEARALRHVVARFLAGESLRSLTIWMNKRGAPSVTGTPWRTQRLRSILLSPRIAGLREHRGTVVGPAVWKSIITQGERARVLARFEDIARSGRRPIRRYLLSGMLRCGKCGVTLYTAARDRTRRYVCLSGPDHGGCGRLTVVARPTEQLLADAVLYRLDTPELAAALAGLAADDDEAAHFTDEIASDREQLDELAKLYAERSISAREWLQARNPIEARIRQTERRLARLSNNTALLDVVGQGSALRTAWTTLTLDRQAAVVRAILDHAVIAPGTPGARSLDPARVTPVWRL
jgi:site-specific DNA recombinase